MVYHASLQMGAGWEDDFERMAGGVLREHCSRRAPIPDFRLHVVAPEHPIPSGMPEFVPHYDDDLYVNLQWAPDADVEVLVTGWDNPLRYGWRFSGPFPSAPILGRLGFDLRAFYESFPGLGTYTVTLTLRDALGETSPEASQQVVVREPGAANTPPTARFVARPPAPFVGQEVTFDASESSDVEGPIIRYEWDTNSDGSFDVTTSQPTTSPLLSRVTLKPTAPSSRAASARFG